jgi:predicted nucleotidyltransferase
MLSELYIRRRIWHEVIMVAIDPVLKQFSAALDAMYGVRLERVVLFGSRARGDARPDSDYDVAVFLKDYTNRWEESDKIADATTEILESTGAFIHAMPYRASQYNERSPLMHEIRREGLQL